MLESVNVGLADETRVGYRESLARDAENGDCPFCRNFREGTWEVLWEQGNYQVVKNQFPRGGKLPLMLVPKEHTLSEHGGMAVLWEACGDAVQGLREQGILVAGLGQRVGSPGGKTVMHPHIHLICYRPTDNMAGWYMDFVFGDWRDGAGLDVNAHVNIASGCELPLDEDFGIVLGRTMLSKLDFSFRRLDLLGREITGGYIIDTGNYEVTLYELDEEDWRNRGIALDMVLAGGQFPGGLVAEWVGPGDPRGYYNCLELITPLSWPDGKGYAPVNFRMGQTTRADGGVDRW